MSNLMVVHHTVTVTTDGTAIVPTAEAFRGQFCDGLNADAAGTATIVDPQGKSATHTLVAGWNPVAAQSVTAVSGITTLLAGWCRR